MNLIVSLQQIKAEDREQVGGKAFALAISSQRGLNVPDTSWDNPSLGRKST
jgi:phosphoenolpyruvate synthase/pyruvate phosphate dikinase